MVISLILALAPAPVVHGHALRCAQDKMVLAHTLVPSTGEKSDTRPAEIAVVGALNLFRPLPAPYFVCEGDQIRPRQSLIVLDTVSPVEIGSRDGRDVKEATTVAISSGISLSRFISAFLRPDFTPPASYREVRLVAKSGSCQNGLLIEGVDRGGFVTIAPQKVHLPVCLSAGSATVVIKSSNDPADSSGRSIQIIGQRKEITVDDAPPRDSVTRYWVTITSDASYPVTARIKVDPQAAKIDPVDALCELAKGRAAAGEHPLDLAAWLVLAADDPPSHAGMTANISGTLSDPYDTSAAARGICE